MNDILEVRLLSGATQRVAECAALVEKAVECLDRLAAFGAYSPSAAYDATKTKVTVVTAPEQGVLLINSPLFITTPVSLRHLVTAIQYQCMNVSLPVALRAERARLPSDATALLMQLNTPFSLDLQWCYKRLALEISFRKEIEPALADAIDERVRAWATFSKTGAYCSQEQFSAADEEFDPRIDVDLPTIGRDWIEWSLMTFDVPEEALHILVNEMVVFDRDKQLIATMSVG